MTDRDVRHFAVYTEGRLALVVRSEPGTLRSSAGPAPLPAGDPGPPGPPGTTDLPPGVHPYIDAEAYDPVSEGRLRELLDASSDFDDYLARLVDAGFDITSVGPDGVVYELPRGARLYDDDGLAGGCWPRRGQFTTLVHQPAGDELVFDATATAYRQSAAPALLDALRAGGTFEELVERLAGSGLRAR